MSQTDPKSILCRYYQQGACSKGSSCIFSHDRNSKPDNVCRYYLQGNCGYGDGCRYDHVRPKKQEAAPTMKKTTPTIKRIAPKPVTVPVPQSNSRGMTVLKKPSAQPEPAIKAEWTSAPEFTPSWLENTTEEISYATRAGTEFVQPKIEFGDEDYGIHPDLCPAFALGLCTDENCYMIHGEICPICDMAVLVPGDLAQNQSHIDSCSEEFEDEVQQSEIANQSQEVDCSICMERVLDKDDLSEQRFGLLPNCDHPFCLKCIREWRGTSSLGSQVRTCPLCRTTSYYIVPSAVFVSSGKEKSRIIEGYKARLKTIDCAHFRRGEGTCPFGTSCFYRHRDRDGNDVAVTGPRFVTNDEGDYVQLDNPTLSMRELLGFVED